MMRVLIWAGVIIGAVLIGRCLNALFDWHDTNRHNRWG